jgi:hypothetical protein
MFSSFAHRTVFCGGYAMNHRLGWMPAVTALVPALVMGSGLSLASSPPGSLEQLVRTPFCAKYRCASGRDRTATHPKPGVRAWNLPLAPNNLGLISGASVVVTLQEGGGLVSLGLNFENAIPGDGSTPAERAKAFAQMRALMLEFNQSFFAAKIPERVVRRCDFETGTSPEYRFTDHARRFLVHCEFFSYTIRRI